MKQCLQRKSMVKLYLCETWVGNPILDQQGNPVVEAGHPLKLQGRGQGSGSQAGEEQEHFGWKQGKLCWKEEKEGLNMPDSSSSFYRWDFWRVGTLGWPWFSVRCPPAPLSPGVPMAIKLP